MTKTLTITCIDHAVTIATTLSESWFRGHDRAFNELTPKIFRIPYSLEVYRELRRDIELEFCEVYKRDAPALAVGHWLPPDEDHLGWLYLMQHYGAPTRLLDWSKSALVALWFAVCKSKDDDGELWAIYPKDLNDKAGAGFGIPILGKNKVVDFLAKEPYWRGSRDDLAKHLNLESPATAPVAFEPQRVFPRLVAQSSAFTIHPRPMPGNTIPELLDCPTDLVRYIIPATKKAQIWDDLAALGISHASLFPDFEGLSRKLIDDARIIANGPRDPPECAGPYPT
jgi:hypothetical protein